MQQAAVLDCLSFDLFSLHEDCLAAPEVDVGGRKVADALVVAKVIVVGDEKLRLKPDEAREAMMRDGTWFTPDVPKRLTGFATGRILLI